MIRQSKSLVSSLMVPLLSILFGFILGAVIMLVFMYDPIEAYGAMFEGVFTNAYFFGEALRQATVLVFTGLGFAIAFQAGFFNIGIAGQALIGWFTAVMFALQFPDLPRLILVPLTLLVASIAAAFWSAIAGVLRAYFGTSEVITTIMLNYTALYLTNYWIPAGNRSDTIGQNASIRLDWLSELTGGSRLNMGFLIAIAIVILYWVLMTQTTTGFEIRSVGLNASASEYAGMSAPKNIILSMFISGALAGLGGAIHGLGTFGNIFTQNHLPNIGFDGIAVALLGLGNPIGIFFSAILFGILDIGSSFMPSRANVPDEIANIVTASIIFFVGANYVIRYFVDKRKVKQEEVSEGGESA